MCRSAVAILEKRSTDPARDRRITEYGVAKCWRARSLEGVLRRRFRSLPPRLGGAGFKTRLSRRRLHKAGHCALMHRVWTPGMRILNSNQWAH